MNPLRFLIPLFLTIVLEEAGAWMLGLRGRQLLIVMLVNMITNPALHLIGILLSRFLSGDTVMGIVYFVLEPIVVLAEGKLYSLERNLPHPYRISLILNVISLTGGILWNLLRK